MHMYCKDGLVMEFKEYKSGLYFFDVTEQGNTNLNTETNYNYLPVYSLL